MAMLTDAWTLRLALPENLYIGSAMLISESPTKAYIMGVTSDREDPYDDLVFGEFCKNDDYEDEVQY